MGAVASSLTKLDELWISGNKGIGVGVCPIGRLPALRILKAGTRESIQGISKWRTGLQSYLPSSWGSDNCGSVINPCNLDFRGRSLLGQRQVREALHKHAYLGWQIRNNFIALLVSIECIFNYWHPKIYGLSPEIVNRNKVQMTNILHIRRVFWSITKYSSWYLYSLRSSTTCMLEGAWNTETHPPCCQQL